MNNRVIKTHVPMVINWKPHRDSAASNVKLCDTRRTNDTNDFCALKAFVSLCDYCYQGVPYIQ